MPTIYVAYSSPINLPDGPKSDPKLTVSQVWRALELKVRAGQSFVAALADTIVISDSTDPKTGIPVVVRDAVFKPEFAPAGAGADHTVREICECYAPTRVDFLQPDGSKVVNLVGDGPDGGLYLTYTFDWKEPKLEGKEQEEVEKVTAKHKEMAKNAVEHTIEAMRKMAKEGKLGE